MRLIYVRLPLSQIRDSHPFYLEGHCRTVKSIFPIRIPNWERKNYFECVIPSMSGDDEDISAFLKRFGFSEEELFYVQDELGSYRTIPGTTVGRYMNRVVNTIAEEARPAFLKGILVGVAIRKAVDAMMETDFMDETERIAQEMDRPRLRDD